MNVFEHRAISASAGTGKTWALTHRYLALLAAGVPPERICALTFSRKAAGEIFDSIVERLSRAAVDEDERRITTENIAVQAAGIKPPADERDYIKLLRIFLDQSHRLRVGTLDSFILGIVRAFPLELGLSPDVRPMDNEGGEAQALRRNLLMRIFDPRQHGRNTAFLQHFRQSVSGRESKSLAQQLDRNIAATYDFYREHAAKSWGDAGRIWPEGCWWEKFMVKDLEEARQASYRETLRQAFGNAGNPARLGDACAAIAAAAAEHAPDCAWPDNISANVLPQLFAAASASAAPELEYSRKSYPFPMELWRPLRAALANMVGVEIRRSLESTAGLYGLLRQYDVLYEDAQGRDGRLSFTDLARRLGTEPNRPSGMRGSAERLYIDYRMDGQIDHWLLDEFQDTNDAQWRAIENLIDEIVQDAEQRRSFFYVGDVKQSIYGWRGGNFRLFGRIRERYGIRPGDSLTVCHRSLPAVIDTVNLVFDGLDGWTPRAGAAKGPHHDAVAAFMSEWQKHESARRDKSSGYTALVQADARKHTGTKPAEAPDGGDDDGDPAQYEAIAGILADVQPVARGLSVAVLVRGNEQGRACADVLRRRLRGVPVVHEGTGGIVDNPVVTLLLTLVRYAAHPADTLALRHMQMSPWSSGRAGWLDELPRRLTAAIHAGGFAGALSEWGNRLLEKSEGYLFGKQRLRQFLAAAEVFDASGSRDADGFCDFIRAHQVKASAAAGAVRVMTVHQSKGLGFDMVLVPFDPNARSFSNTGAIELLRSDFSEAVPADDGWVLRSPRRVVLDAAGGAPVAALAAARTRENFGQLCVLYVAVTRAKRALYMIIPEPAKRPGSVREADLLCERLCGDDTEPTQTLHGLPLLYEAGDREWSDHVDGRKSGPETAGNDVLPRPLEVPFTACPVRREPSKDRAEGQPFPASYMFDHRAGDVRDFGLALHRLFERIEWIEDADMENILAEWHGASTESPALLRNVEEQFRRCLGAPAVRALLSRPHAAVVAEAWRETPFDYVRVSGDGTEILTGRFDRLVIERDRANKPVRATVIDFKSNRVPDTEAMQAMAAGYHRQMDDYAAAAARLLGLSRAAVGIRLLFTRLAEVCEMPLKT